MKVVKVISVPYVLRDLASLQNPISQEPNVLASESISATPHNQIREGIDNT